MAPEPSAVAADGIKLHIRAGRVVVRRGSAEAIPFPAETFQRVLSIQTVYFWDDVRAGLAELHRVLAPDGRLALAIMGRKVQEKFEFGRRGYTVVDLPELVVSLRSSGFTNLRPRVAPGGEHCILAARRP